MKVYRHVWLWLTTLGLAAGAHANLLRNGGFQDDWLTQLAETKNHHWCYSSEFYNRRDFNPDGWTLSGNWIWQNAEAPYGQRRLVLGAPVASLGQQVNWLTVHDDRRSEGFPDAGGFPQAVTLTSDRPESLMRDLTFRVQVKGRDVPTNGVTLSVGWPYTPPKARAASSRTVTNAPLPAGNYDFQWVELKLPASAWFQAVTNGALPGLAQVGIQYKGATGQIEIARAELVASDSPAANLLANGGFETLDKAGYPAGWSQPEKYRYFPPRLYYLFNTWHNAAFSNRGPVAADALLAHGGARSLKMIVAAGDEKYVASAPIVLNQVQPRAIEVSAWVRTDRLCMLQIDALDQDGKRLDGFNFIHKAPVSIGTDGWRMLRQVFRPREPVKSLRLQLCARGVNGYTLDDTAQQPQNNVCGTIWWDDVRLGEPESTAGELAERGVKPAKDATADAVPHLADVNLGERLLGENVLSATLPEGVKARDYSLQWEFVSPSGRTSQFTSAAGSLTVAYTLTEPCPKAYTEYHGTLTLLGAKGRPVASSELWFGTWTEPVDLQLGALYLLPDQKELVRLTFGLTQPALVRMKSVRLEVRRLGTGKTLRQWDVPATPEVLLAQRAKIPLELRGDFANLLLTNFDASFLPLQPFNSPERNWFVRATVLDEGGKSLATADSPPFCRQAHEAPQSPIESVSVKGNGLFVNGRPWMPWGAIYGFIPVYDGPADPGDGKYRDLSRVPAWSIYDRFGQSYSRSRNDFNCARYVVPNGGVTPPGELWARWTNDNLYCSSAFGPGVLPGAPQAPDKVAEYQAFVKTAPMVVSMAAGIEEAFGYFHALSEAGQKEMDGLGEALRKATGKPVMIGHGGYWNRLEFERARGFDIYDPETEPLYPANLHTDLAPLLSGRDAVAWLRPQMYEDVPYERWRFHAYVELMRGCRGWQFAHGPGDQSLFRGLHGEMEFMKPIAYSTDPGPNVTTEPAVEHFSRRYDRKLYIIAATTHGMTFGDWRWSDEHGRARVTGSCYVQRDESNSYGIGGEAETGPAVHGMQYLPDAQAWPVGTKLVQDVRLDPQAPPTNLVMLVKADGRWTNAAAWGTIDLAGLRGNTNSAYWFLTSFYRHARGFLGWDKRLVPAALPYVPAAAVGMGAVPAAGGWVKLELPLETVGVAGKLVDGVGFLHEGGRVWWGRTLLVAPDGTERMVWGDQVGEAPERLARTTIKVPGLKAGAKVRVVFEDREVTAEAGEFVDDFRGTDLYERYGGGPTIGYGDTPVALHVYELSSP